MVATSWSGRVRARSTEHDVALSPPPGAAWDGTWIVAVVTADARSSDARAALRRELRHARYAEQREGVWCRPDNLPDDPAAGSFAARDRQCRIWRARPDGDARELAVALFAPAEWNARAVELDSWLRRATTSIEAARDGNAGPAIADAFLAGTRTLAHLRADPLLPAALLPHGWHGDALRRAYESFQPSFEHSVAAWFRAGRPGRGSS